MAQFEEKTHISEFNVQPDGSIRIRKTTSIFKDGDLVSSNYWRTTLSPADPSASNVLDEPYYASMAKAAWTPEVVEAYKAAQAEMLAQQGAQA